MGGRPAREAKSAETVEAGRGAERRLPPLGTIAKWRRLAEEAFESNPFFTPPLVRAALAHLADDRVRIAAAEDEAGRLAALAPIRPTRLGRLVPAVAVWTHLYGPYGAPLLDPARPDDAVRRLLAAMEAEKGGRRVLLFPDLPAEGPVAAALLAHAEAEGRPVAWIGDHPRAVLDPASIPGGSLRASLPAKMRKDLARQLRRLAETGELLVERISEPAWLGDALDDFLALEAGGWKGRRGTALEKRLDALGFARDAVAACREGEVMIDALRLDGRALAMLVSFRAGDTAVTWKIAYDERFARFSPGVQVMVEASDAFLADPTVRMIDSLAIADHPMVDRLWPDRRRVGLLAIGPEDGSAGFRLGVALARAEVAARDKARKARSRLRRSRSERGGAIVTEARRDEIEAPLLELDAETLASAFPERPFPFRHRLADHPLLQLGALADVAATLPRDRLEYNSGRLQPNQKPEETPAVDLEPEAIVRGIETAGAWMVLKNVEQLPPYRELILAVLGEAARAAGHADLAAAGLRDPQGFIFVSSADSVTPFHLDYEENFFVQLHGDKAMHVFDNRDRTIVDEEGLESFPGKHRNHPYREAFEAKGTVYGFAAGDGLFLPYTWPHWVRTGEDWSISMAITWKSPADLRLNKLYFANAVLRRVGLPQSPPGRRPALDAAKVAAYDIVRLPLEPLRRGERMRRALRGAIFGAKANYYYRKAGKA